MDEGVNRPAWRAVRRGQGWSRELAGVSTIVWGTRGMPELGWQWAWRAVVGFRLCSEGRAQGLLKTQQSQLWGSGAKGQRLHGLLETAHFPFKHVRGERRAGLSGQAVRPMRIRASASPLWNHAY